MKKLISFLSLPVFLAMLLPQVALAYTGVDLANAEPDGVHGCDWTGLFCSYTNETLDARDAGTGDVTIDAVDGDKLYVGFSEMFDGVAMDINVSRTAAPGGTFIFEYYNGTGWTELDLNADALDYDIENDTSSGVFSRTWQRPTDWTTTVINGSSDMYYVRMRISGTYPNTPAKANQIGIIDYNLKVEVLDELGYAIEGMEETDFVVRDTGILYGYAFEELGDGLYGFAIDIDSTTEYELYVSSSGFVTEDRTVNLSLAEALYDDFDMGYSHLLMAENEVGTEVGIDEATAGVTPVDCIIDGMEAYCAVDAATNDGTGAEAYVYADGYVALTDGITNRSVTSTAQAQESYVLEYGYIATVKDESGNPLTAATVKAGDALDLTCDYIGSGHYGCPISLSDSEPLVEISLTGYETLDSVFGSERTAPASAQVATTFRLTEETTEEPDPDPDPVDDGTDTDSDGLTDMEEDALGTDETDADTDNDGLDDGEEVDLGTDPKDSDSDSDGLEDGEEVDLGTDPDDADTDNDGDEDGDEVDAGTDPLVDEADVTESDSDGDGLDDDDEADLGTDPDDTDSDDDGIGDGAEVATDTDPLDREDFLADAEDYDADCSDPFTDTAGNFAEISICLLYDEDIVQGRSGTHFEPSASITRAEFLKIALLNAGLTVTADSSVDYDDVNSSDWYYSYITYATAEDYVEGYEDGNFRPNDKINRAEAMIMMMRIAGVEEGFGDDSDIDFEINFSDVDDSDWYAWAIVEADEGGISEGYSDGTFQPGSNITRAEVAVIARRVWYVYFE